MQVLDLVRRSFEPYLDADTVSARIGVMARTLPERVAATDACVVTLLEGARLFSGHVTIRLPDVARLTLAVSSYGDALSSSGRVTVVKELDGNLEGRNALVVDDILDTGRTFAEVERLLLKQGAASIRWIFLLAKEDWRGRLPASVVDVGFFVPDGFYVGWGLDLAGRHRDLRTIYRKAISDG
ncbi:hypoxanthine phosphoribosyltransferase [bacterium]|nr:hypoxanthine phosphoribosyltransferase [bacterium]